MAKKTPIEKAVSDIKKSLATLVEEREKEVSHLQSEINHLNYELKHTQSDLEWAQQQLDAKEHEREELLQALFGQHYNEVLTGWAFEEHVVWWMDQYYGHYRLKIWQGDKASFGYGKYFGDEHIITPDWNKYPDLIYVNDCLHKAIALECKYRFDGKLTLTKEKYDEYKRFEDRMTQFMSVKVDVYLMVGTGGNSSHKPDWMYCIPIDDINFLEGNEVTISMSAKENQRYKVLERRYRKMCIAAHVPFK